MVGGRGGAVVHIAGQIGGPRKTYYVLRIRILRPISGLVVARATTTYYVRTIRYVRSTIGMYLYYVERFE
jgi:hypothetical protein